MFYRKIKIIKTFYNGGLGSFGSWFGAFFMFGARWRAYDRKEAGERSGARL